VAGRIRSTEKSNDLIGNQTRDLPACSTVSQPTMLLCAPVQTENLIKIINSEFMFLSNLLFYNNEFGTFFMDILVTHNEQTHFTVLYQQMGQD
jgi:hypothetical protein